MCLTELGALFGVTRQAAGLWLTPPAPPASVAVSGTAVAARRPAQRGGVQAGARAGHRPSTRARVRVSGACWVIAADEHEWLFESVRRSFDYAAT